MQQVKKFAVFMEFKGNLTTERTIPCSRGLEHW